MLHTTRFKKIFYAILGVILISIILFITAFFAISVYGGALQTSLPEQQAKAEQYALDSATTPNGSVVFLGDSITEMFDLQSYFPDKGYINRGISSNETAQIVERLQTNVIDINPSTIVLLIGANDIGHNISELDMMKNFTLICDMIGDMATPPKLLVQSIYPTRRLNNLNSYFGTKSRTNESIVSANELILNEVNRLASEGQDIHYINTHSILVDSDGSLIKNYTIEGLHINSKGYKAISNYLSSYLQ